MPLQNIGTVYRKELTDSLREPAHAHFHAAGAFASLPYPLPWDSPRLP